MNHAVTISDILLVLGGLAVVGVVLFIALVAIAGPWLFWDGH